MCEIYVCLEGCLSISFPIAAMPWITAQIYIARFFMYRRFFMCPPMGCPDEKVRPHIENSGVSMATRTAMRYVSRRLSSSGRVLSEEEKAAENVYIKKKEQEKLEKLAREGPKPEKTPATGSGGTGSVSDAKTSGQTSSTPKVSTDSYRNYAVVAGIATAFAAFGWYYGLRKKESDQVQD
ncbi:Uncharacterized protein Adt_30339 [Abeliophyllum distichum]|uniref:Copper ion binding protein n=1 Tax=Abeliophyllum distichum TaxID=126358 RepID=A0ABD1RAZ8_9LAMI